MHAANKNMISWGCTINLDVGWRFKSIVPAYKTKKMRWIQANLPNAAEKTTTIVAWQCKYCHLVPHSHSSVGLLYFNPGISLFQQQQQIRLSNCCSDAMYTRHRQLIGTPWTAICCLAIQMPHINIWMPSLSTDLSCTLYERFYVHLLYAIIFIHVRAWNGERRKSLSNEYRAVHSNRSWFFRSISLASALVLSVSITTLPNADRWTRAVFGHSTV